MRASVHKWQAEKRENSFYSCILFVSKHEWYYNTVWLDFAFLFALLFALCWLHLDNHKQWIRLNNNNNNNIRKKKYEMRQKQVLFPQHEPYALVPLTASLWQITRYFPHSTLLYCSKVSLTTCTGKRKWELRLVHKSRLSSLSLSLLGTYGRISIQLRLFLRTRTCLCFAVSMPSMWHKKVCIRRWSYI